MTDPVNPPANPPEKQEEENTPAQNVHEKSFAEIMEEGEHVDDQPKQPDESKPGDEAKNNEGADSKTTQPPEEKKDDQPPASQPPAIDPEKLSQKVAEDVVRALTGGDEEKKTDEEKEAIEQLLKEAPWVKEGRNPTYEEVVVWTAKASAPIIQKKVIESLNKEAEEEEKRQAEAEEQQRKLQEETNKHWAGYWDSQLAELESTGKIPKIVKPGDKDDPGVKARIALYKKMGEVSKERAAKGVPIVMNIKEIYYDHFQGKDWGAEPPGTRAPVYQGRRGGAPVQPNNSFTYDEIHGKSIEDIAAGR